MGNAVSSAFSKYATFSGRATRSEYWWFILFQVIAIMGLAFLDGMMGTFSEGAGLGMLSGLFCLALIIPTFAVGIRRMHDTGRSGWWTLINLIPLVGPIIFIVLAAQDSQAGTNSYGPSPKAPVADEYAMARKETA
jgi:uncharacterized membrane protein YhaH (DUF805 family)